MIVTADWIKHNYEKFNKLYFDGELPKIEFKVMRSRNSWGYAGYTIEDDGTITPDFISISTYYDCPEHVLECTLLHEMIHIKDYTFNKFHFGIGVRYDAHGAWFMNEAKRFIKYGYDIQKDATDEEQKLSKYSDRTKQLIELKKLNTRMLVVVGDRGKVFYCKTNIYAIKNAINAILRCKRRIEISIGNFVEISSYTTDDEGYALERSVTNKVVGWTVKKDEFDKEASSHNFKYDKLIKKY